MFVIKSIKKVKYSYFKSKLVSFKKQNKLLKIRENIQNVFFLRKKMYSFFYSKNYRNLKLKISKRINFLKLPINLIFSIEILLLVYNFTLDMQPKIFVF